jgi:thiosulfate reductase cytochrome b subunit
MIANERGAPPAMDAKADSSKGDVIYRHTATVRITHWVNALVLLVLLMSGLQIFNAHPALYLGAKSDFDDPILAMGTVDEGGTPKGVTTIFGYAIPTTGVFGLSGDAASGYQSRGFPWWATLPGYRNLAMGRRWHFFFAWLFLFNGLAYLLWSLGSGHLRRDLAPSRQDLAHIGASIREHARLNFPKGEEAKRYNVLQKLAYLAVALVLLPLMLLTGLGMSPGMDAAFPLLLDIFGGRQTARTIHFISATAIVLFVVVHLVMVVLSGLWNNLRSMITGRYAIEPEEEKP